MQVRHGLPDHLRPEAAALYWQAFGGKLGRVLGPDARALAYLQRVMRGDHCLFVSNSQGALIGIAGFKSPEGGFANGEIEDMKAIYGKAGGLWRSSVLRLLQSDVDNDRFLVDGICVARAYRSQGVGSALLDGLMAEARERGYGSVRLEVIDTNIRARALYERLGFAPWRSETLGLMRHVVGFDRTTTMIRDV